MHDRFKLCIKLVRAHQGRVLVQVFLDICKAPHHHTSGLSVALFLRSGNDTTPRDAPSSKCG
jgi:hypothetical protein